MRIPRPLSDLSQRELIKKLDKVFSEYIRQRDKGICFTCGKQQAWKLTDNGHYIRRGVMLFRFNEKNCHCQCKRCNSWMEGEKVIYRQNLVKLYGEGEVDMMERESHKTYKWHKCDLIWQLQAYSQKVKDLDILQSEK